MIRARSLLPLSIALVIGCSLAVDTSGLSHGSDAPDASTDGPATETSTNGDGGGDAGGGDSGDAGHDCPFGRGPEMVRITDSHGSFCVDKTEVTQTQFNAFLSDTAPRPKTPNACAYRTTYGGAMRPADNLPVVNVDWCEAWMFCAWSGKRLCGSRTGATIDEYAPAKDPAISEWFAACSRSAARKYPYGNAPDPSACNGCDRTGSCPNNAPLLAVASLPKCEGGYAGVFDMIGNVSEWESDCNAAGATRDLDECPSRGKDTSATAAASTCEITSVPANDMRKDATPLTGIRCCAN